MTETRQHSVKTLLRYQIFAQEYVIDLNATRSAIAAGYCENTATVKGSQLLTKVKVQRLISELQTQRASKLELKAEQVVEELRRLAFSNMSDYMGVDSDGKPKGIDFSNLTRDQAAAIQEIREDTTGGSGDGERRLILRTTLRLTDKGRALELLGRHLGMFQDNLKVTGLEGLAERINQARAKKHGVSGLA